MNTSTKSLLIVWGLAVSIAPAAFAQINQDHPALCGDGLEYIPIPSGLSVSMNRSNGEAVLQIDRNGLVSSVTLSGIQDEVRQICPIEDNRVVVFGWSVAYTINVVDLDSRRIVNFFVAFEPAISPNRKWMILRSFYPANSEIPISDQYLLFDLRPGDLTLRTPKLVYPQVAEGSNPSDVPDDRTHKSRSEKFSWSKNSASVTFVDASENKVDVIGLRLAQGRFSSYHYPVKAAEGKWAKYEVPECRSGSVVNVGKILAEFVDDATIAVKIYEGEQGCSMLRKDMLFSLFVQSENESYPRIQRRRPIAIQKRESKP